MYNLLVKVLEGRPASLASLVSRAELASFANVYLGKDNLVIGSEPGFDSNGLPSGLLLLSSASAAPKRHRVSTCCIPGRRESTAPLEFARGGAHRRIRGFSSLKSLVAPEGATKTPVRRGGQGVWGRIVDHSPGEKEADKHGLCDQEEHAGQKLLHPSKRHFKPGEPNPLVLNGGDSLSAEIAFCTSSLKLDPSSLRQPLSSRPCPTTGDARDATRMAPSRAILRKYILGLDRRQRMSCACLEIIGP
jgi:hypothetical protein